MKELEQHNADQHVTQEVREIKKKKGEEYMASITLYPGQQVWRYDMKEDLLRPVCEEDYETTAELNSNSKKLIIKPGIMYVTAINKKNAAKKVKNMLRSLQ